MGQSFLEFAKTGLHKAMQNGADHAELFVVKGRSFEVELKNNHIDDMKQAESSGVGLRVLKDGRAGFSFSSDFRTTALDKMVVQAITNSRYSDKDETLYFPTPANHYPQPIYYDGTVKKISLDEKLDLARETTHYAEQYDSRVKQVERSCYEDGEVEMWLANSNGVFLHQLGNYCGLSCLALGAQNGEQQSGYGMDSNIRYTGLSAKTAGEMAARRAVQMLGAAQIESGKMDLVLEPMIAAQIMGIISSCFSGEAVRKKKSFLAGKLGDAVANSQLTLIDDGTLDYHMGSASFDGEGMPTQRTVLIENGVLQQYLYDTASAAKAGTSSTGNGMRGGYKGTPHVGTTNYYVKAGSIAPAQLISEVSYGVYITDIMGAHTANAVSGDFSFGASGILIEHGQLTHPVRGITIAGNFQQLLQKISGIGSDLTFFGSQGAPTIRIAEIAVSGK